MTTLTASIDQVTNQNSKKLDSPKRFYFEVHGDLKMNGPEVAIGFLTTDDIPSTMKRLTSDYRFNHLNPERVILGTSNSSHYNLSEKVRGSFEPSEIVFGEKPYQIHSYKLINSR